MATTVFYPGYSAGADAYYDIEKICSPFGTKAVVISDEISINATKTSGLEDFFYFYIIAKLSNPI